MPKVDYYEYLASREWRQRRKKYIQEETCGLCERCASGPIENVHHTSYARVGHEHNGDLIGVCKPCHQYLAAEREGDPALPIIHEVINESGLRFLDPVWLELYGRLCFYAQTETGYEVDVLLFASNEELTSREKALPRVEYNGITLVFEWIFLEG